MDLGRRRRSRACGHQRHGREAAGAWTAGDEAGACTRKHRACRAGPAGGECMTADKPKIAFYWCASCGGCEEAVVDLAEEILDVVAAVDIVFWPVALDYKRHDVVQMPDGSILATFLNGAIRTSEQEEMAELLRRKSKLMVAFGSCS